MTKIVHLFPQGHSRRRGMSRILLSSLLLLVLTGSTSALKKRSFRFPHVQFTSPTSPTNDAFNLLFTTCLEEVENMPLTFSPPLPEWMEGLVIRNGLGRFEMGEREFQHAFDAYGKLMSLRIEGGGPALFSTKFIRSQFYKKSVQKQDIAPYLVFDGVKPSFNWFQKGQALINGLDNPNTNVKRYGRGNSSSFVALADFWALYKVKDDLHTKRQVNARIPGTNPLTGFLSMISTAHPQQIFRSSDHVTFVSSINPLGPGKVTIVRVKDARRRKLIATITGLDKIPYMHSFGLTKNYAVIFAAPLYVSVFKMMLHGRPMKSLEWEPKDPMKIYVVDLRPEMKGHPDQIRTFSTPAVFPVHTINGIELKDGKVLQIDASTYPDDGFFLSLLLDTLRDPVKRNTVPVDADLKRFTIDLDAGNVSVTGFPVKTGNEFINRLDMPAINENYKFSHYCYVYGLVLKADSQNLSSVALVKKDLCNGGLEDLSWWKHGQIPMEPIFFPRPGGVGEDDGYLLSVVLDANRGKSYFVIIDALTMETVSKSYIPFHIPFTLHGDKFDLDSL